MKKLFTILCLTFGLSALAQPTVVVSLHPYYALLQEIVGDNATVIRILPPGASPHTFDPTPRDVARISGADLVILNGGLDEWLLRLVQASGTRAPVLEIIDVLDLDTLPQPHDEHDHDEHDDHDDHDHDDHDHAHDDHDDHAHDDDHDHAHGDHDHGHAHDHGGVNPHFWLDPLLMVQAVRGMTDALVEIDPANADAYRANAEALVADLEALHEELLETLEPIRGAAFVPFHDAWPYFAARYGLDLIVEIEPFPGREPTASYLAYALGLVRDSGARAIFSEVQLSRRPAEVVAENAGVALFELDPIGGGTATQGYAEMMRYNAQVLLEALGD